MQLKYFIQIVILVKYTNPAQGKVEKQSTTTLAQTVYNSTEQYILQLKTEWDDEKPSTV